MAKQFKNLVAHMSPQAQKQVKELSEAMLLELNLQEPTAVAAPRQGGWWERRVALERPK